MIYHDLSQSHVVSCGNCIWSVMHNIYATTPKASPVRNKGYVDHYIDKNERIAYSSRGCLTPHQASYFLAALQPAVGTNRICKSTKEAAPLADEFITILW